jgi:hypothetical protein
MMNILIRLTMVSFLISALAFGIAGYAVSRTKGAPLEYAIEDLQGNCAFMLEDIKILSRALPAPGFAAPYYGVSSFPPPVDCAPEIIRPF